MRIIADLHLHSRFSRATSSEMSIPVMAQWAERKGINLIGTGDFTHPIYFEEIRTRLKEAGNGLYRTDASPSVHFMLTTEISSIYSYKGRVRRIHNIVMAPSIEVAERINNVLKRYGNLSSDGRPILGTPANDLIKIILNISPDCLFVPAHAWTPWFSIFGSNSGFDSIEECFGEYSIYIYAIETGLSSDPEMNWRLSSLDRITLISNSDAHSPNKLGREANVFDCEMDYYEIIDVIKKKDRKRFLYTIEFFPEEGKYHYDGHRSCNVLFSPSETKAHKGICPVCNKPLTVGVMNRVEELADREEGFVPDNAIPSRHMVPLDEVIAQAFDSGTSSARVRKEYERLTASSSEFEILLDLPETELYRIADERVAQAILKVRRGEIDIVPGYDGVYGKIKISIGGRRLTVAGGEVTVGKTTTGVRVQTQQDEPGQGRLF
ncbi:MAG: endonuclease Q family protein [Thermodesulfovibrionia bacterium]